MPGASAASRALALSSTLLANDTGVAVTRPCSMGAPYLALFLRHMTPEWRQQHIAVHISLSGGTARQPHVCALCLANSGPGLVVGGWLACGCMCRRITPSHQSGASAAAANLPARRLQAPGPAACAPR